MSTNIIEGDVTDRGSEIGWFPVTADSVLKTDE